MSTRCCAPTRGSRHRARRHGGAAGRLRHGRGRAPPARRATRRGGLRGRSARLCSTTPKRSPAPRSARSRTAPTATPTTSTTTASIPSTVAIAVAVTIATTRSTMDFEGSSPQFPVPLNSTLSFTKSSAYCRDAHAACARTSRTTPGSSAPITVTAPPGTHPQLRAARGDRRRAG